MDRDQPSATILVRGSREGQFACVGDGSARGCATLAITYGANLAHVHSRRSRGDVTAPSVTEPRKAPKSTPCMPGFRTRPATGAGRKKFLSGPEPSVAGTWG